MKVYFCSECKHRKEVEDSNILICKHCCEEMRELKEENGKKIDKI